MKTNAGERWFSVFFLPVPSGWNLYMLITYGWCCTEGASEGAVAMWKRLPSPHGKLKWTLRAVGKIPSNNEEEEIDDATRPLWAQNHWNHWSCPAKVGLLFRNLISRRKHLYMKKKSQSNKYQDVAFFSSYTAWGISGSIKPVLQGTLPELKLQSILKCNVYYKRQNLVKTSVPPHWT